MYLPAKPLSAAEAARGVSATAAAIAAATKGEALLLEEEEEEEALVTTAVRRVVVAARPRRRFGAAVARVRGELLAANIAFTVRRGCYPKTRGTHALLVFLDCDVSVPRQDVVEERSSEVK
jgi:hypothetical protein